MRFIFSLFLALTLFSPAALAANPPEVGEVPPDFLGEDKDGNKLFISDFKGQVVIVTFWATWCPPCLEELPYLEEMQRQIPDGQLKVIAINYKQDRRAYNRVIKVMDEYQLTFAFDRGAKAAKAFGVKSIPHMFMIAKNGKVGVVRLGYGENSWPEMVEQVNGLLRWQPTEEPVAE